MNGWTLTPGHSKDELISMAESIAAEKGIPPALFKGLIQAESSWNPYAKNPKSSARGLGQHLDGTAKNMGLQITNGPDDPRYDPETSLRYAADHLLEKYQKAGGDWHKAIKYYGENTTPYLNSVLHVAKKAFGYLMPSEAEAKNWSIEGKTTNPFTGGGQPGGGWKLEKAGEWSMEPQARQEVSGVLQGPKPTLADRAIETYDKGTQANPILQRELLKGTGFVGGGIAGGVAGGPPGAVAGAGLGYAMGNKGADLLDWIRTGQYETDLARELTGSAEDVKTGAMLQMLGDISGKILSGISGPVKNWLSDKSRLIYESTLKIPPSVKGPIRERTVTEGMQGGYNITKGGLKKLSQDTTALGQELDDIIASSTKEVKTAEVVNKLKSLKDYYVDLPGSKSSITKIEAVEKELLENWGEYIPVAKAQSIKTRLYSKLRRSLGKYGEYEDVGRQVDEEIARGLKEGLEDQIPGLREVNQQYGSKANLETFLSRAVNRVRNYDVVSLGDRVVATAGAAATGSIEGGGTAAIISKVLRLPEVQSFIAFQMNKAAQLSGPGLTRPFNYTVGKKYMEKPNE